MYLPTNPILASPVLATSNPSPLPPPPPLGWINSRRSLAKRALRMPRWLAVALFRCVRAIYSQNTKGRTYRYLVTSRTIVDPQLPRPLCPRFSPIWLAFFPKLPPNRSEIYTWAGQRLAYAHRGGKLGGKWSGQAREQPFTVAPNRPSFSSPRNVV